MFIAIHADAERKPKAIRAAAALKLQPRQFIFQVMCPVWMFAAENHDGSGDVTGLDDDILKTITFGICDSVNLLIDAGWLVHRDGRLFVPAWAEHEPYFARKAYDKHRKRIDGQRKSGGSQPESSTVPPVEEKRGDKKRELQEPEVPPALLPFKAEVEEWLAYKKEKGQPYKPVGLKRLYKSMVEMGGKLPAAVKHSITNNYAGLFPPNGAAQPGMKFTQAAQDRAKYENMR